MKVDSLVLRVRYWDVGIATRLHVTLYSKVQGGGLCVFFQETPV